MMHSQAVYRRALSRAVEVVGRNIDLLAVFLDASPKQVTLWLTGVVDTPDDVFLKVVDLLMDEQRSSATREAGRATYCVSRP